MLLLLERAGRLARAQVSRRVSSGRIRKILRPGFRQTLAQSRFPPKDRDSPGQRRARQVPKRAASCAHQNLISGFRFLEPSSSDFAPAAGALPRSAESFALPPLALRFCFSLAELSIGHA